MKLPRGVSGERVVRALQRMGYEVLRQKGSHVRVRNPGPPIHSITVPLHDPLKTGTIHGILSEVAQMRSITVDALADLLPSVPT
jgi:predicted RNA binding protein YcfA (HicA-like mRNA interferase family)